MDENNLNNPETTKPKPAGKRKLAIGIITALVIALGVGAAVIAVSLSKKDKKGGDGAATEAPTEVAEASTPTPTAKPTDTPTPTEAANTKSFLSVYEMKSADGTELEHYEHDEYGRRTHFDRSNGMIMDTTYEKGGAIVKSTYNGQTAIGFYRDPAELLPGEEGLIAPNEDYVLEYDEKGFWKSISFTNRNGIEIKQNYFYTKDGILGQYETLARVAGTNDEMKMIGGMVYTYDAQGRLMEYYLVDLVNSKTQIEGFYTPVTYRVEYTDNSKKITETLAGKTQSSTEWIYEDAGTWYIKRTYDGDKVSMMKYWIIPMPESYKEVREMAIGIDMAFEESSYPIDFKKDAQGRLTDVTITMPESGVTDYPIISVKYYGDGLLDSITDALHGAVTKFEYDIRGDVNRTTAYDEKGNLMSELNLEYERIAVKGAEEE